MTIVVGGVTLPPLPPAAIASNPDWGLVNQNFLSSLSVAVATVANNSTLGVNVTDFFQEYGGAADGVTDCSAAFQAAHDSLSVIGSWRGGFIKVPKGRYFLSVTWDIFKNVTIFGDGMEVHHEESATELILGANTTGIHFWTSQQREDGGSAPGSTARDFHVHCNDTDSTGTGIFASCQVNLVNVAASNFAGDGIAIVATSGTGTGNANKWTIQNCYSLNNAGNGLYVQGSDANVGTCISMENTNNLEWQFFDGTGLGNHYIGCLAEAPIESLGTYKAIGGGNTYTACYIEVGGNYGTDIPAGTGAIFNSNFDEYNNAPFIVITGDGTGAAALVVGTGDGGVINTILMTSSGHGYTAEGTTAALLYGPGSGCVLTPVIVGGKVTDLTISSPGSGYGSGHTSTAAWNSGGTDGGWRTSRVKIEQRHKGSDRAVDLDLAPSHVGTPLVEAIAHFDDSVEIRRVTLVGWNEVAKCFETQVDADPTKVGMRLVHPNSTTETGGRDARIPEGSVVFPLGLFIGDGSNSRWFTTGSAAPASGYHARGERVFDLAPSAAGTEGWVCTAAGTPGTWKTFGVVGS